MTDTPMVILKYLQPDQYYSWLRKATDPEWDEEKFGCSTRSKAERAAAAFALELRECFERIARLEQENKMLREALVRLRDCDWVISLPDRVDEVRAIAREALKETEGGQ